MLSGNKCTSRSSLGSAIYQCLQQKPKEDYLSAFRDWVCLFVLMFYGPVNPMGSCQARSVYLTTLLLGRLSPLSG